MLRPVLLVALSLSASGWAVSARAEEPPSGRTEGVTRPAPEGRDGVTRPAKPDEHDHEREGPKSSAPT